MERRLTQRPLRPASAGPERRAVRMERAPAEAEASPPGRDPDGGADFRAGRAY